MRSVLPYVLFLVLPSVACVSDENEDALQQAYTQAIDLEALSDASIITDRFIVVSELNVVFPRPQGDKWVVTKRIERGGKQLIVDVEIADPAKGSKLDVIIAKGSPGTIEAQARLLATVLARACGTNPRVTSSSGLDGFSVWLSCVAEKKINGKTVRLYMRAAVAVKRRIPGRTISAIGLWPPSQDEEMNAALIAAIERAQPLLDATIGHP